MGTSGIHRMIEAAAEDAGFDHRRVHPNLLRATAITRMCNHHPAPEDVWQAAMRALES